MSDTLGYRKRIGIIVPSTNTTVGPESELFRVPGVTCHITVKERALNTEEAFFEHMTMKREGMRAAIDQIMTGGLDHLIVGTPGPPKPEDLERLVEIAQRYGYWTGGPADNAAVGISFGGLPAS